MGLYLKDLDARIDHGIDWADELAGATVVDSVWSVAPTEWTGLVVEASAFQPTQTSVWVSGGRVGRVYRLSNRVTLSDGQVRERSATFRVEER